MNNKQLVVILLGIIGIILIVIFTPRYKITWIDTENYIQTEQNSPLFKRSAGEPKMHWDKIIPYSAGVLAACGLLVFLLRNKTSPASRRPKNPAGEACLSKEQQHE